MLFCCTTTTTVYETPSSKTDTLPCTSEGEKQRRKEVLRRIVLTTVVAFVVWIFPTFVLIDDD